MSLQPKTGYTFEDYLTAEREELEIRHEYVGGEVFAMVGANANHNTIVANIIRELGTQMKGGPCHVYSSDMRVRIEAADAVRFIEMGVKAVIAAGWAVDDQAASTFARRFYHELIGDRSFGDAVRLAREETWKENPAGGTSLIIDRCWSLTGIYARRVQTLPATERKDELLRLIESYGEATEQLTDKSGRDPLDPYSRLLWLTAKLMLTAYSKRELKQPCPAFEDQCCALQQRARQSGAAEPGFSVEMTVIEIDLLLALWRGELVRDRADDVIRDLRSAMLLGVTHCQQSSLRNFFDLLYTMAAQATVNKRHFRDQAGMVARIRDAISTGLGADDSRENTHYSLGAASCRAAPGYPSPPGSQAGWPLPASIASAPDPRCRCVSARPGPPEAGCRNAKATGTG